MYYISTPVLHPISYSMKCLSIHVVCAWACGGQRKMLGVALHHPPPSSFETESLAEHGVSHFWLNWQPASPSEPSVSAQLAPLLLQAGMATSGFLDGC